MAAATVGGGPARAAGDPEVFVAPGAAGGDGSTGRPLGLSAAIDPGSRIQPGTTIWVKGGTYTGCYTSSLTGTAAKPIKIRAVPGERVIIDGATCKSSAIFTVNGAHTWIWGLEVMSSEPTRTNPTAYDGTEIRPTGINVYGPGTKIINVEVHDAGNGIGFWAQSQGAEINGALLYNNGWVDPSRGHGHGIYAQNRNGAKRITDVISLNNFSTGMKAFATNGYANGFTFDRIISANNGSPAASSTKPWIRQPNLFVGTGKYPVTDTTVTNSRFYQPAATVGGAVIIGWATPGNGKATVTDNVIAGGGQALAMTNWLNAAVTNNTLHVTWANPASKSNTALNHVQRSPGASPYTWDRNTYFDGTPPQQGGRYTFTFDKATNARGGGNLRYNEWQAASGADPNATYKPTQPTGTWTTVYKNDYEPGRGHIAIYNWDNRTTTTVDLTPTGLKAGQRYEIRDAQNFHGAPVATGTWNSKPVNVPLTALTATQPLNAPYPVKHTSPTFATFIVVPIGR